MSSSRACAAHRTLSKGATVLFSARHCSAAAATFAPYRAKQHDAPLHRSGIEPPRRSRKSAESNLLITPWCGLRGKMALLVLVLALQSEALIVGPAFSLSSASRVWERGSVQAWGGGHIIVNTPPMKAAEELQATEEVTPTGSPSNKKRRPLQGVVLSDKMNKTITVRVERLVKHPKYHKRIRRFTNLHVHDESNECQPGDTVIIDTCRPLSKTKAYRLLRIERIGKPHERTRTISNERKREP